MKLGILSNIKSKFNEILAFVLLLGLFATIFQLIVLQDEIEKDVQNQVSVIAPKIKESVLDVELVSDSIEHQIDLRLISYSKNIADILGDKSLDEITNEELEVIRKDLKIGGITLFARRGDDIVAIKSTDPKEIGFGFKRYENGGYELINTVLEGHPEELLPVSYIDERAIVTPVTRSGSQPDTNQYFKYAHYHKSGASYLISCFIHAGDVFQFTHRLGPDQLIQQLKEENPYIKEIGVLMPKVFENPNLEELIYPSYKRIDYGTFNEPDNEEIEMLKGFNGTPYQHYTSSKDGRKLYKAFLPMDENRVIFISLDYEKMKGPMEQRLLTIMILAILSSVIFILLAKKISRKTKETEDKLWESKQILSSIIEHSPLGIIVFDQDHRIMIWNKSAELIYGPSASQVEGQLFPPSLQEELMQSMISEQRENQTNFEFTHQRTDGSLGTISCSMAPLRDAKNRRIGYVTIHRDITVHKQMEEKLLNTEKLSALSQLSAAIGHEIRNPLTSIKGFVQLMKETSKEDPFYLNIMESELDRINDIVSEFMSLAKPQALQFSVQDIRKILKQTFPLFESIANLNNITIKTDISNEPLPVYCIEHQLKQVFINIMKNSIEAMPSNGHLQITANPTEDGKISIRFVDNGAGISEERLSKLGEPFYTTKEKGSGLGLMICYKIIHTHEGDIHISSTIGVGTTVEIVLPSK